MCNQRRNLWGECVQKRLVPFIRTEYKDNRYWFWPDGASSHYAKSTIEILEKNGLRYIEKTQNPPNVPQLRCIEKFWAHLKQRVYKGNWTAKDFKSLKTRIIIKLNEFYSNYFRKLLENEKIRIAKAAEEGPLSVIQFNK